jgi:uncharacterized protein YcbK (DUF882 family)
VLPEGVGVTLFSPGAFGESLSLGRPLPFNAAMERRLFLLAAAALAAAPLPVRADPVAPPVPRRLDLSNAHTGERFSGPYRDAKGPIAAAMADLSEFLRDFHCGATIPIDVAMLDFLATVIEAAGETRAIVLSAYRTPATNAMLARTTFGVAEHSQHLYGKAIDFTLSDRLEDAMLTARAMQRGGIGWYPQSHFIHLDSGPVRNWNLEGRGFERMLLDLQKLIADGGLTIGDDGRLVVEHSGRPLSTSQRLAMHRLIARAAAKASIQ